MERDEHIYKLEGNVRVFVSDYEYNTQFSRVAHPTKRMKEMLSYPKPYATIVYTASFEDTFALLGKRER